MEKLALIDGEKNRSVPEGLRAHWPRDWISKKDIEEVIKTIKKGEYWKKDERGRLEEEWARYCGAQNAISVNSGTAALHIALSAAGVGPGDEVITPSLSFLSSASAILHNQGIPVFVDIDPRTFNIDPDLIEQKITNKTRAIIPVHMHGLPVEMDKINLIAKKYNLAVIEDGCQSPGAEYRGGKVGSLGDFAAFSLNQTKNLSAFGGGLLTINNDESLERLNKKIHFRRDDETYDTYELGWNYNYNEVGAAFARTQLRKLDEGNKLRQENAEHLSDSLKKIRGLSPPLVPKDKTHVYYIYRILLEPEEMGFDIDKVKFRDYALEALLAEGVAITTYETSPVPSQGIFKELAGYGKGCPWNCKHARDAEFEKEYDKSNYPITLKVLNSSIVLYDSIFPPNGSKLMDSYIKAFQKIFLPKNMERIITYKRKQEIKK